MLLFSVAATSRAQDSTSKTGSATAAPSTPAPAGLFAEPRIISRGIDLAAGLEGHSDAPKDGFYPELGRLITGGGWISAGPGYRHHVFAGHALVDGSAAISWRAYKMVRGKFELPNLARGRVAVGSEVRWQDYTQVNYFGIGTNSLESDRSEYRLKTADVVGYATVKPVAWLSIGGRFGLLKQPTLSSAAGPFDPDFPNALQSFPLDPGVADPTRYLHGDVSIVADTRDHAEHPSAGGLYRAAAAQYSDRQTGQFSFRRFEVEGAQFIPLVDRKWVIALHGWGVVSDTSSDHQVPFYLLPALGGDDTLRGYYDYRFHDRDLLVANVESRWALFSGIEAAAFVDAGNVAARVGDLNLDKWSYGVGIRAHSRTATLARLDVGHSTEGWRLFVRLNDPFGLSRLSRKSGDVPFVP
jgi:hypothetical protein